MKILGIDPGLQHTGWGVIEKQGSRLTHIANGVIHTSSKAELAHRLVQLHTDLSTIIHTYKPDSAAIEQTFVNKDAVATLKLGHARAIGLFTPALYNIPIAEYASTMVKKAVVGVGHADKTQVQHMIKMIFPAVTLANADAADALAIAVCHSFYADSKISA